ncbi:hypothetical protein XENTR_v10016881 [Xenopus tropicalis]|nr:hypothetical protein XENTR_v10016881 [Xenopus tropicalis]
MDILARLFLTTYDLEETVHFLLFFSQRIMDVVESLAGISRCVRAAVGSPFQISPVFPFRDASCLHFAPFVFFSSCIMSVAFAAPRQRGKGEITPAAIQKMLDENNHLIQCIMDYQNKGKTSECSQYQQMLHTNLVYLATIADSNQNTQPLLSALPTQNMPMGPAGMNQSGPPQPPRAHNMPSEGMVGGGPSAPHMQNQMNGQMPGPNHMPMQGPGPGQHNMPNSSMNMPSNNHGSMGGYNHSVPSSQNIPAQNQMSMSQGQSMGNYGPRPNMNIQPNQGPPQQYSGQEEYYGEQYSHGAQGNAQYSQQQESYQGPQQQQGYPPQQQQYAGQQAYPGQQQGYAPSQSGPGPQYPNYPQGQSQQYVQYRPTQPGPPQPQQQRPYGYDQGQYGNYQQ